MPMADKDRPQALSRLIFQEQWLNARSDTVNAFQLKVEHQAILRVCSHFEELEFRGITVRIDGKLYGYALGCGISENTFDVFLRKGGRSLEIYAAAWLLTWSESMGPHLLM